MPAPLTTMLVADPPVAAALPAPAVSVASPAAAGVNSRRMFMAYASAAQGASNVAMDEAVIDVGSAVKLVPRVPAMKGLDADRFRL